MASLLSVTENNDQQASSYGSTLTYTSSGSRPRSCRQQQRWTRYSARTDWSDPGINVSEEDAGPVVSSTSDGFHNVSSRSSRVSAGRRAVPCPRFPGCKVMCSQRIPRGRRLFLILVMLVIERYVLYGAIDEVLDLIPELDKDADMTGLGTFLRVFLFYCVSRIFYPVGGFIADVYMGRCRVIHMSLWFYWIAFALLIAANMLQGLQRGSLELYHDISHVSWLYTYVLPIAAYVFMILAAGGFEPTLIPFGADQLEAAGSNELSSYFYWYYFAIQLGPLLNIFVNSSLSTLLPAQTADTMQVLATIIVTTCGLVLHKTLEHWYFKNIVRENCIKLVGKVLWYVARVKRRMPQYRRAFRYGEGKIKRIDLAKRRYDGIFTGNQVEEVKTFCLLCLIIFCLCGYFFSQSGVVVMMSFRVNATIFMATANSSNVAFLQSLSPNMFIIVNSITGLLFVPLVNHIFIPCLPCVSIRARMAIGMIVNAVAIVSAGSIEYSLHNSNTMSEPVHTLLLFIVPTVLITLPESLTYTSALEFIYAQSPESMKGMLTGLFYFILGIFSGGSTVLFYLYLRPSSNYAYYYWILLVFSVVGLVTYVIAATVYVNRRRPSTTDSEEVEETRLFYNNISIP